MASSASLEEKKGGALWIPRKVRFTLQVETYTVSTYAAPTMVTNLCIETQSSH